MHNVSSPSDKAEQNARFASQQCSGIEVSQNLTGEKWPQSSGTLTLSPCSCISIKAHCTSKMPKGSKFSD